CYGDGGASMDDTNAAEITVSPHMVRVGEQITATITPYSANDSWTWPVGSCDNTKTTCTFTADARTPAHGALTWQRFTVFGSIGCCGWVEEDYYTVTGPDEYPIEGNVAEFDPTRAGNSRPSARQHVTISGPDGKTATTNENGNWGAEVAAGTY